MIKPTEYSNALLETYRQAHETRRKWEGYIWQWGILLTVLAAIFANWKEPESIEFLLIHKVILTLIAGFVFAIFLNVMRARILLKELEKSIRDMIKKTMNFIDESNHCSW